MQSKNDTLVGSFSENRSFTQPSPQDFYIGLTLALLSSFFIGSSFILKKKGLLKLTNVTVNKEPVGLRAAHGGHGYLKEWLWWSGFLTMGVGEVCNFVAYMFAPATLVTPLGAISVLISAVMAAYFLNEKLNTIGKIGCLLTAIGSTVMVIHAPKEGQIRTVSELLSKILDIEFISYCVLSIISLFFLIFLFAPRYGNKNILIYILICSILGSYTVMSCKGIALGVKEILNENRQISYFYTLLFILTAVGCIVIQINYLNKSLDIFNTAIVTTVYYVLFTLFVMIASSLLFKELLNVSLQDFLGCMCGFSTIICALCLIHFFKTSSDNTKNSEFKSLNSLMNEKYNNSINNNPPNDLLAMVVHQDSQIAKETENITPKMNNHSNDLKFLKAVAKNTNTDDFHRYNFVSSSSSNVNNFDNVGLKTNPNEVSFLNYLNMGINNFKGKYLKRSNLNYEAYNYKKLMTNEIIEEPITTNNNKLTTLMKSKSKHTNSYKPLFNREVLLDDDEDEIEFSLVNQTDEMNLIKK